MSLAVRRLIRATPERLFDAWTRGDELLKWWGPHSVQCTAAEVDLRVGGRYRLANRFPDGAMLWISGEFEIIERPTRLAYTWQIESRPGAAERVTVLFEVSGADTLVTVTHERISDAAVRDRHEQGWRGCLDRLANYLEGPPAYAVSGP
jgi:uncharacterized protein YndB with AHSA1/START domain